MSILKPIPIKRKDHSRIALTHSRIAPIYQNSHLVLRYSGMGARYGNSYLEQAHSGIAQIPIKRVTYILRVAFEIRDILNRNEANRKESKKDS